MTGVWMIIAPTGRSILGIYLWLLLSSSFSNAAESDINCLKSLKASLQDPLRIFSSWDFSNQAEGFICRFAGVECWHPDENRVLNIRLPDLGLKGKLPLGLANCSSMTGLDLSNNKLYGTLPVNISKLLPFAVTLDLSSNNFTGEIPVALANCSYLNILKLDNNQFTGQIPRQLGRLKRLKEFSVANNRLSGRVPIFQNATNITAESYAGNPGLCGRPLPPCQKKG